MSDAGGGAAPAQISVTTDYETFRQFIKDAVSGFEEVESRGSKLTKSLKQGFLDFGKAAVREALKPVREAADVVLEPLQTSIRQATQEARVWRKENTTIAAAMGKDWRTIGRDVDEVATRTRRPTEELRHYLEAQGKLTGNWDTAKEAVGTYSKLASYSGKRSVEELAPLAAKLETTFGIKGQERVEEFWRSIITGAERAGVGGARALGFIERMAGRKPVNVAKERGEAWMQDVQQLRNALMKSKGYSAEQAESIVDKMVAETEEGGFRWQERFLRAHGQLGKGEDLIDRRTGLMKMMPSQLYERTARAELHRAGGNRALLGARMMQPQNNYGSAMYGAALADADPVFRAMQAERMADAMARPMPGMEMVGAQGRFDQADAYRQNSEEGIRQFAEQRKRRQDRGMGESVLGVQDRVAAKAPGGVKGVAAAGAANLLNPLNAGSLAEGAVRAGAAAIVGGGMLLMGAGKDEKAPEQKNAARDMGAAFDTALRKAPITVRLEATMPPPPSGGMQTQ